MFDWPEVFHCAEDWANGFLVGAAASSLVAIAVVSLMLLARAV
jgi:hypothetical protein